MLRYARYWQAAGWLLCLIVLGVTMVPLNSAAFIDLPGIDKLAHLLAFLALTLWLTGAYQRHRYKALAVWLLVFGALIEIAQHTFGQRTAEALDWLANAGGISIGFALALVGLDQWCYWVEANCLGVRHDE